MGWFSRVGDCFGFGFIRSILLLVEREGKGMVVGSFRWGGQLWGKDTYREGSGLLVNSRNQAL